MAYIGNSPSGRTVLQLEARKSFSLSLRFADTNRRPADLSGCTVRLVIKAQPLDPSDVGDADNLITSSQALILAPTEGYCQFNVQASELNHAPGEYPFAIVLVSALGYSSVAAKGIVNLVENTEFASISSTYSDASPPSSIEVLLRGSDSIDVIAGHVVPPGFTWMSDADKEKIDGLSLAGNLLPAGGGVGMMLRKRSEDDYDFEWIEPQAYNGTLSATGQARGRAPVSNGSNGWAWGIVPSDTTGVPAGYVPTSSAGTSWSWLPPAFGQPASIAAGTDLDSVTVTGLYHQHLIVNASVALNYPVATAGLLEVFQVSNFTYQRYTTYAGAGAGQAGRVIYMRAKYLAEAWTTWAQQAQVGHVHSGVDITTGEVAAARLPRLTELRGVTRGTGAATGGTDGDIHLRYI